jgi:hypothetical protein
MDTAEIVVLTGGCLLIAWTLWFFFGARDDESPARVSGDAPLYACPMHPWITSNDPTANCSICGMKLVRADEVKSANQKHAVSDGHHH